MKEFTNETMQAIVQDSWGGPETLHLITTARPRPLPTEVRVRVLAASVNPIDAFTRAGLAYVNALSLPHVPGWDIAGVVDAVGYGVTRFRKGDEVFGMPWFPRAASAYAEYATAPAMQLAHKPAQLSFEQAAALPLAGLTAWQMLVDTARVVPGQRVLINGAAGGVGHLAVQIAKARGAHVIAVARGERHAFVRELGADEVVDYKQVDVATVVRDIDVVIELVGGQTCIALLRTLRPGGLLVSAQAGWIPTLQAEAEQLGVRASWYLVEPDGRSLDALAELVVRDELRVHVGARFALAQAAAAQDHVMAGGAVGKTVLTIAP